MITLRNKFDALQLISETLTLNDKYENFVNAYMEMLHSQIYTYVHRIFIMFINI